VGIVRSCVRAMLLVQATARCCLTPPPHPLLAGEFSPLEAFLKFGFVPQELWG
jgi:hypothetical protein